MITVSARPSARERMIAVTERLVAERGLASVSARDVLQAADQRNKSAISYHFGSWDGLIAAVLTTRMAAVGERRRVMLSELDERSSAEGAVGTESDRARCLVEAMIVPMGEHCVSDPSSHWARFLYRCLADPSVATVVRDSVEGESFRDVTQRLVDGLDHVPAELRQRRAAAALAMAITSLAELETQRDLARAGERPGVGAPVEVVLSDLVDVATAMVGCRPSSTTNDLLAASVVPGRLNTDRT